MVMYSNPALTTNPCGSELAREEAPPVDIFIARPGAFASKLAPTGEFLGYREPLSVNKR